MNMTAASAEKFEPGGQYSLRMLKPILNSNRKERERIKKKKREDEYKKNT